MNAERETPFYASNAFCAESRHFRFEERRKHGETQQNRTNFANQTKPASDGTFSASQSLDGVAPAGTLYGYARVSARDQNLARQLDALRQFGVPSERIFADKASGKDFERPAWRQLTGALAPGDVLIVKSIDRFGRNYEEIQEEWRRIVKVRGAAVVVLDMPLLDTRQREGDVTSALIADIVLQLLSYVAQWNARTSSSGKARASRRRVPAACASAARKSSARARTLACGKAASPARSRVPKQPASCTSAPKPSPPGLPRTQNERGDSEGCALKRQFAKQSTMCNICNLLPNFLPHYSRLWDNRRVNVQIAIASRRHACGGCAIAKIGGTVPSSAGSQG